MSVNGVTGVTSTYATTPTTSTAASTAKDPVSTKTDDIGVVYEKSTTAKDGNDKVTDYSSIISNLKQELNTKNTQLQNLVNQLLGEQANKYTKLSDLFKNINADPATIAQAQKDIGEDGYWGIEQTSERLVSMAKALSGGDSAKADQMIAAMKKGFDQATAAWGDKLPSICQDTIDAAVKKMESWRDGLNVE